MFWDNHCGSLKLFWISGKYPIFCAIHTRYKRKHDRWFYVKKVYGYLRKGLGNKYVSLNLLAATFRGNLRNFTCLANLNFSSFLGSTARLWNFAILIYPSQREINILLLSSGKIVSDFGYLFFRLSWTQFIQLWWKSLIKTHSGSYGIAACICPYFISLQESLTHLLFTFLRELQFQISEDERRKALIAGSNTSKESEVTTKKSCKQRRASASQKKAAGGQSKTDHLTEAMFANFQYLAPDFQIILLERILNTYTSKKQFEDEVDFFYPFSVSITIMLSLLCMGFL